MTLLTVEHIAELSHAELVALVKELIAAVQRLAENQQLKAEVGKEPLPLCRLGRSFLGPRGCF